MKWIRERVICWPFYDDDDDDTTIIIINNNNNNIINGQFATFVKRNMRVHAILKYEKQTNYLNKRILFHLFAFSFR